MLLRASCALSLARRKRSRRNEEVERAIKQVTNRNLSGGSAKLNYIPLNFGGLFGLFREGF